MTDKRRLEEFENVRQEYNSELKELRDRYEPKFQEILGGMKNATTPNDARESVTEVLH